MTDDITNWMKSDETRVTEAIRRGATRRELLSMMMAGGASLAMGGLVIGRATRAAADTPKMGGKLRAAGWSSSTADTLDPAKASLSTDYVRICMFYNRLVFLDATLTPTMELAESIDSKDAQTWTIKLRSGVTFHDGKALSSADVVYSLKRHLDPAVGSKVNAIAKQMKEITATDPSTVTVALEAPNADLPTILGLHHFMIVQDGTTDFSKGMGTGPFICKEFTPGVRSISVKNPNYWKKTGPYLDEVEFFAISDSNARLNALLSGDIELAGSIDAQQTRQITGNSDYNLLVTTAGNYTNLNMRLDMSPGDKADFVEGMKYLLNREQIQKAVMRGYAEIGNDQPVSPANRFHNADLKPKAFDPDKAKALFTKAGLIGQSIPIVCSDAATASVDMATLVQQAGADIGMKFDVQRKPSDGYWSNYWLKAPIHFGNINPRPTPDILFSLLYKSDAAWNESQFKNEKFDKMLAEARGILDFAKRKEIYDQMQVMVADQAGTAIPVYISGLDAMSSKLKGVVANPLGGMMGYAFAEYAWLDA